LALAKEKPESSLKKDTSLHMVDTLTKDLNAPKPPEAKIHQGQNLGLIISTRDCVGTTIISRKALPIQSLQNRYICWAHLAVPLRYEHGTAIDNTI
jgi:hypothetical protein